MTDTQLVEYIVHIMNINGFRNTTKWSLIHESNGIITAGCPTSGRWTQVTYALQLLKTWIDNPAAAQAYLTAEETSKLRLMIATHFLQYGAPN